MQRRNVTRANAAAQAVSFQDIKWRYFLVVLVCGFVIAAGFFFAARQHFASMDYSIKNSSLKKQIEDLEAENRRLQLAREIALSPAEIRKASRASVIRAAATSNKTPSVQKISLRDSSIPTTAVSPAVVSDAVSLPAKAKLSPAAAKSESTANAARKPSSSAKEKRDAGELTVVAKLR